MELTGIRNRMIKEMLNNISDEKLMMMVKEGNPSGLGSLFERYNIKLYNYYLKMGLDREMSRDLTQNIFYRMLKYKSSYTEGKPVKAWIYQIARNLYYDYYNEKKLFDNMITQSENIPEITDDNGVFSEEDFVRLEKSLLALAPGERELLVLSRYQGLKYHEISPIVNQSVPAIKVGIFRAIKKLRTIYFKQV